MHKPSLPEKPRDIATSLRQLDGYIAEGRRIIRRQARELRDLRRDGQSSDTARALLAALCETTAALHRHREVLRQLAEARLQADTDNRRVVNQHADS